MASKKPADSTLPTLAMPMDSIVQELGIRSGEILLTPPQAAAIMQTSTDQLSTMREVGDGPPFTKLGDGAKAPVRYHLGKLRQWMDGHTFQLAASDRRFPQSQRRTSPRRPKENSLA